MSTHEQSRRVHELVDAIKDGYTPDCADVDFLRSFLPPPPKQKTLDEIVEHVRNAWAGASDGKWAGNSYNTEISIEDWLRELYAQLAGLTPAKPAHPEFLDTEADYRNAPGGTVVAIENADTAWIKKGDAWSNTDGERRTDSQVLWGVPRKVLRWGEGE